MPKFDVECQYCGRKWIEDVWNPNILSGMRCKHEHCRDSNLKIKQRDETHGNDVYGYRFSKTEPPKDPPARDSKLDDDDGYPFNWQGHGD